MRRDLFIGIFLSLAIHAGVAYFGNTPPKPKPRPPKDDTPVVTIVMPPMEPDEQEVVDNSDAAIAPSDIAPPMQTDIPSLVNQDSFVQTIEPPPPEGLKLNTTVVKVPGSRMMFNHSEVFDISKLDQQPQFRLRVPPQYPFDMKRQGIEGTVLIDFIIDINGDVQNAFVVSSTQRDFEAPALLAVSKWKFRPGRKNGHAVNSRRQQPIEFKITQDDNN